MRGAKVLELAQGTDGMQKEDYGVLIDCFSQKGRDHIFDIVNRFDGITNSVLNQ